MNTKKTYFSTISNILFVSIVIFSLSFMWVSFYTRKVKLSIISSIIIVVCFLIICIPFCLFKSRKQKTKNITINNLKNFKTTLKYQKYSVTIDFIKTLMNYKILSKINDNHYVADNSVDIYLCFNDNIILDEIYSSRIYDSINIFCLEDYKIPTQLDNVKVNIYNAEFLFLSPNQSMLPPISITKKAKYSLKNIFCIILDKKKSKNYFYISLVLLITSLFTPFTNYYIVVSTVLFILSLLSRFSHHFIKDA